MMDISVSHLNNRLALQLPAELPLGLVFVVGNVDNLVERAEESVLERNGHERTQFDLVEASYRLRCQLAPHATPNDGLQDGDKLRVGGHLMFDSQRADYFLMARDVEVISEPTTDSDDVPALAGKRAALTSTLADVKKRAEAAQLAPADLPTWVQKMAPPEVQAQMEKEAEGEAQMEAAEPNERPQAALSSELVEFASAAMESEEEVELKPEVIEKLAPAAAPPPVPRVVPPAPPIVAPTEAVDEMYPNVEPPPSPAYVSPPQRHETDWLVILLIFSFLILTIAVIVASILLVVR
ncbi:MAG TPA: hypothetical protein VF177_05615 [Anaerolineae bacterium]